MGSRCSPINPGLVRTAMTEYLLEQPRVGEHAPWFPPAREHATEPPESAGRLAVFLSRDRDSRPSGRMFRVEPEYAHLLQEAEQIVQEDLHVLRLRTTQA